MRWDLKTADPRTVEHLAAELNSQPSLRLKNPQIASTLARLLVMRGISEGEAAERFLSPALSHLHSPYLMVGLKTAVDRIEAALENKESILIYGDYDVDGTTAIVVLKTAIELCGGTAEFHVRTAFVTAMTCATTSLSGQRPLASSSSSASTWASA